MAQPCLDPWALPGALATYSRSHFHSDILKQGTWEPGDASGIRSSDTWSFSPMQEMRSLHPPGPLGAVVPGRAKQLPSPSRCHRAGDSAAGENQPGKT